jgi:hypothetical protein
MKIISNLIVFVNRLLSSNKRVEKEKLPSQGLFYKDDFNLFIKRATKEDIAEYKLNFVKDDLGSIISKVKKIVENNLILPKNYKFHDLKSIDVVFLFIEIVKFTKSEKIKIKYLDEEKGEYRLVEFDSKYFNYYKLEEKYLNYYNEKEKLFIINDYKFSLPSIGVENSLTKFLIHKSKLPNSLVYNNYSYDFTYFLGHKNFISFDEIDNLIEIFNSDLDDDEKQKIKKIIEIFLPLQKYSLIKDNKVIEINSKIDLGNIWK